MTDSLELRAFAEGDLGFLERLDTDPAALGPFEWVGFAREGVLRGGLPRRRLAGPGATRSCASGGGAADAGSVLDHVAGEASPGGGPGVVVEAAVRGEGVGRRPRHRQG